MVETGYEEESKQLNLETMAEFTPVDFLGLSCPPDSPIASMQDLVGQQPSKFTLLR